MTIKKSEQQELLDKLNELLKKQSQFQQEISELEKRIVNLSTASAETGDKKEEIVPKKPVIKEKKEAKKVHPLLVDVQTKPEKIGFSDKKLKEVSANLEKFIGENLISKIGIAVLIIGVGIGTKYAIDNNLISPLVRIILGYLVGFVLTFFALRLKKKYHNFSAVLFSGAMAIHYFITYAAYTYFGFYPNALAFILMVLITVITVALALYYNRQVIAHFGLAGAYIIPFLLRQPDSSIVVLFTYMGIINTGILYISTKKQWKPLNYLALISTWVIFMSWFASKNNDNNLGLSLTFSSIFFVIFYLVFLSYKLNLKEKFRIDDIIFLLLNSGMFYLVGMIALEIADIGNEFGGLLTFGNAVIHAFTAWLVYRTEKKEKNLFYWTIGLVITFFTVAIPIQFKTSAIIILWGLEAAALFWYSKRIESRFYEILSFVVVVCIFSVSMSTWSIANSYNFYKGEIETLIKPVLNPEFLATIVATASLLFIFIYNRQYKPEKSLLTNSEALKILFFIIIMFVVYFTFYSQINLYWNNVQVHSAFELNNDQVWIKQYDSLNEDVFRMKSLWLLNYSIVFGLVLALLNVKWLNDSAFSAFLLVVHYILILVFFASALNILKELRESYLDPSINPDFDVTILHIAIRYVAYIFFALLLFSLHYYINPALKINVLTTIFEIVLCIALVWLLSSELINWLSIYGSNELYKHGLSILWGVYSLLLVAYGIWKKKKHLRVTAIVLFGITLIKLFFYDLTNLQTVPKTIVFVSIGALLLLVSFLYNKYRKTIFGTD